MDMAQDPRWNCSRTFDAKANGYPGGGGKKAHRCYHADDARVVGRVG
jgi:hypothetical protein